MAPTSTRSMMTHLRLRMPTIEPVMPLRLTPALLILVFFILPTAPVLAHGGVSLEDDLCVLRLGNYQMHFTGYQPEQSGAEEFCEDIPGTGTAVIVLDAIDDALRGIPLEVRILRDDRNLGNDARVEELGGVEAIAAATVAHLPAAVHATGSTTLQHRFETAGRFIGYIRAEPAVGGPVETVFPFAVGGGTGRSMWPYLMAVLLAAVVAAVLFLWASRSREVHP